MSTALIDLLRQCTVRVHGKMPGAGFFVAPNTLVTCAHVVGIDVAPGTRVNISATSGEAPTDASNESIPDAIVALILPHADEDLAVLTLTAPFVHPCVLLGGEIEVHDPLYSWGFPDYEDGRGPRLDGLTGSFVSETELPAADATRRFLKFTGDRVVPGCSGGPLLNLRSGCVIGVVTETIDSRLPLGGWAIPIDLLKHRFPDVIEAHQAYHAGHSRWSQVLTDRRQPLRPVEPLPDRRQVVWPVEPLPDNFARRDPLLSQIVSAIVDDDCQPIRATVSLVGFGGFGKTTLARATLLEAQVRTAYDRGGAVWVTLGQRPKDLVAIAADVVELLTGLRPGFASAESALQRLQEVLSERRPLMVIDDVWRASDARPLLAAGEKCSCILTTRHSTAAGNGPVIDTEVGMTNDQSIRLLTYGLSVTSSDIERSFAKLAESLHHWPILLSLANAALRFSIINRRRSLEEALSVAQSRIETRGLTAFDSTDARRRDEAVALTVGATLELLDANMRPRFAELAVFPEDAAIPLSVLRRFWKICSKLDDDQISDLIDRLLQLSLVTPAFPDAAAGDEHVRLHDVLRAHAEVELGKASLAKLHGTLVDSVGVPWPDLSLEERYLWEWLGWHLVEAGRTETLASLLVDFDWISRRISAASVFALLAEFRRLPASTELSSVERAIRLSAHAVAVDATQLSLQLAIRLREESNGMIVALRDRARANASQSPLRVESTTIAVSGRLIQTLVGHSGVVTCAALSRDAQRALSGSWDGTVRVWDLRTGSCIDVLDAGDFRVSWVAFSDDDTRAIAVTSNSRLRAWDLETRRILVDRTTSEYTLSGAALDDENQRIFIASWGWEEHCKIDIWDLRASVAPQPLVGLEAPAVCLLVGAEGAVFAGDADGFARRWQVPNTEPVWSTKICTERLSAIALSPDSSRLAAVSNDGVLAIVDALSGRLVWTTKAHQENVRDVKWTLGGRGIVCCSQAGDVAFFDVVNEECINRHYLNVQSVNALATTMNGSRVLSGDSNANIRLWNAADGLSLGAFTGHTYGIWAIETSTDGARAVTASGDWTLRMWDLTLDDSSSVIQSHSGAITGLAIRKGGNVLSTGVDRTIRLWHRREVEPQRNFYLGAEIVHCVAQPGGSLVALGLDDGSIILWDNEIVKRWNAHEGRIQRLKWKADGATLASSHERTARHWTTNGDTIEEVSFSKVEGRTRALAFVEGSLVVVAPLDSRGGLRTFHSGDIVQQHGRRLSDDDEHITEISVAPDGASMISVAVNGPVRLWDLATRTSSKQLDRWPHTSSFLRVTDGGEFVTAGSYEGDCWVWCPHAGTPLIALPANAGPATDAHVIARGKLVVTRSAWAIGVWDLEARRRLASFTADGYFTEVAIEERGSELAILAGDALGRVHWLSFDIR